MKLAAGTNKTLIEFGLRRAQGPDGAMMATQYSYLGGFDGTSNVAGGKDYGIPIYGTMAHAYICSFKSLDEVKVSEMLYEIVMMDDRFIQLMEKI
jgi:nicotinate phosphoribosyltransferase